MSRRGPVRADMADPTTIDALFTEIGTVDAVVCCAANGSMSRLNTLSDSEFWSGLDGKLLGQVTLTRRAIAHLRDGGSVTLTSGQFTEPTSGSSLAIWSMRAWKHSCMPRRSNCRATFA